MSRALHLLWMLNTIVGCAALIKTLCHNTTDVIILIESRIFPPEEFGKDVANLHKSTVEELVHRLPMGQGNVRTTVIQFDDRTLRVKVIFKPPGYSPIDIAKQVETQDKIKVLETINAMKPIMQSPHSNLLNALNVVQAEVLPVLGYPNQTKTSNVIIAAILTSYWRNHELSVINKVVTKLRLQGVTTYAVAFKMNENSSLSVLPEIVSKPEFLILPSVNQARVVASHLVQVFQVCWKDGPCWPENPCLYGCSCIEDETKSKGYYCVGSKDHWLGPTCDTPSPTLSCLSGKMLSRIPISFIEDSRYYNLVYTGSRYRREINPLPPQCIGKLITKQTDDPTIDPHVYKLYSAKGSYYLVEMPIQQNVCGIKYFINSLNATVTAQNLVYVSRSDLPPLVQIERSILLLRCTYQVKTLQNVGIEIVDRKNRALLRDVTHWNSDLTISDESLLSIVNSLQDPDDDAVIKPKSFSEGIIKSSNIQYDTDTDFYEFDLRNVKPAGPNPNPIKCVPPFEPGDPCLPTQPATTQAATTQAATTRLATTQAATTGPATTQAATTQAVTTQAATTGPATTQATTNPQTTLAALPPLEMILYYDEKFNEPIGLQSSEIGSKVWAKITSKGATLSPEICVLLRDCWLVTSKPIINTKTTGKTDILVIKDGCVVPGFTYTKIKSNGESQVAVFSYHVFQWKVGQTAVDGVAWARCFARYCTCKTCKPKC